MPISATPYARTTPGCSAPTYTEKRNKIDDYDFRMLLQHLDRPWAGYRKVRKGVKKRIQKHMDQVACTNMQHYLKLLESQPDVKTSCERCLFVTISRFFRDRRLWQELERRLLPQLIRKFESNLRIWSAGCASGEEPYSIAMVFSLLEDAPTPSILATDAQSICLERARNGRYGRSSLKEIPEHVRNEFFSPRRGGRNFKVKSEKLPPIQWMRHNILSDPPPPGPFHMVFLRNNLLTYYQGPNFQSAFNKIVSVIPEGGYLAVGSHEKPPTLPRLFRRDRKCPWVYQKFAASPSN